MNRVTSGSSSRARDSETRRRHPGDAPDPDGDQRSPDVRRSAPAHGIHPGSRGRDRNDGAPRHIGGSAAVEHAKSHLTQFTGQPIEAVSSLNRTRDAGWRVVLEVLELERIPRTTDILASYAVELDEHGDLMGYERIHRYYRNDVSGDQ